MSGVGYDLSVAGIVAVSQSDLAGDGGFFAAGQLADDHHYGIVCMVAVGLRRVFDLHVSGDNRDGCGG